MEIPVCFVHIPKTAGYSLTRILDRQYRNVFTWGGRRASEPGPDPGLRWTWEASLEDFPQHIPPDTELIRGHIPYGVHYMIQRPVRYITMLRNPVERVISAYYFLHQKNEGYWFGESLSRAKSAVEQMTIEEFVEHNVAGGPQNGMTSFLAGQAFSQPVTMSTFKVASENLREFAVVGITEAFTESIELMAKVLRWPEVPGVSVENVNHDKPELSGAVRSFILEHNQFDAELYQRVLAA